MGNEIAVVQQATAAMKVSFEGWLQSGRVIFEVSPESGPVRLVLLVL